MDNKAAGGGCLALRFYWEIEPVGYRLWSTLVCCGTLLVLAPSISDYLLSSRVARAFEQKNFENVSIGAPAMSSEYRFGCWVLGAGMIGIGVAAGWREHRHGTGD